MLKDDGQEIGSNFASVGVKVQLPPQMDPQSNSTKSVQETAEVAQKSSLLVMLLCLLLASLGFVSLQRLIDVLLSLQVVLYIPVMNINLPAIVNDCFEQILSITTFDPYPEVLLEMAYEHVFGFEETQKVPQNEKFAQIGFESRNPIAGLGGNFVTITLFAASKIVLILVMVLPSCRCTTAIRNKLGGR